ncbi:MAG: hypothetical protein ABSB80_09330 [Methanoregula sp.]|jgi:hypothetical protein|uniref:hypothetical protein n=1 Tax=Methanoregula sp. TaxID=2052170 RepID=UPI003D0EB808
MTSPETLKEIERIQSQIKHRIIPSGSQPPHYHLINAKKDPEKPYKVIVDDRHHFKDGGRISNSEYLKIKDEYDIRIKRWDGKLFEGSIKNYYLSGPGREAVKDIAFKEAETKKEYPLTHFHIAGNRIQPHNIVTEAHDNKLKVLWVDVSHQPV